MRSSRVVAWAAAAVCLGAGCGKAPEPAAVPPKAEEIQPVARVDGAEVSLPRFNLIYRSRLAALGGRRALLSDRAAVELKRAVARELIDEVLVEKAARRRQVTVTDRQVQAALDALAATYPSPEAWRRHVANAPQQEAGLRLTTHSRLLREALAGVDPDEPISEAAARRYYGEHQALYHVPAHLEALDLVIKLPPEGRAKDRAGALALAEQARAEVTKPRVSFPAIAARRSDAPAQLRLGMVTQGSVEAPIWKALGAMKPGEISGVVEAKSGLHVLKLVARVPAIDQSFEAARPGIDRALRARHRNARLDDLMTSLRRSAQIENLLASRYPALLAPAQAALAGFGTPGHAPLPESVPAGPGSAGGTRR